MKNGNTDTIKVINVALQSIFSLAFDIFLCFFIGWILVDKLGLPSWVYIPLIILGVMAGFISMVKFIISAMNGIDKIEAERQARRKQIKEDKKRIERIHKIVEDYRRNEEESSSFGKDQED